VSLIFLRNLSKKWPRSSEDLASIDVCQSARLTACAMLLPTSPGAVPKSASGLLLDLATSNPGQPDYCSPKSTLRSLSRCLYLQNF
jgi:hypothetical protein